jgi:type VI secretion system protein ImpJ
MSSDGTSRARNPWSADALSRSLCRVRWRLGQALLPEHFFRQEFSLRQEWELRFAQLAPPSWGVGLLEWDESLIARGFAKLGKLMLVFPRGQLVHIPGNSQPVHFDLNAADGVEVALYAHLLSAPDSVRDDQAAGDAAGLELLLQKLELSPERGHPGAIDSIKLGAFKKSPDGQWSLQPTYVPPLLLLSAAPAFFRATLDRVLGVVQRWQELLLADIETHALATEKVVRAQECLRRSHLYVAALAQIDAENPFRHEDAGSAVNAVPPADVYQRLLELYIDIHSYQEDPRLPPRLAGAPYDHHDPYGCFERLLADLDRRTELPLGQAPYVAFASAGEAAVVSLPREAREAREVYFLFHRRGSAVREELRGLKVACRPRLETVHRHALKGIPLRRVQPVPFRHSFAPEVEFYQLLPGEEWEHALRQGTLAYFTEGGLKDGQAYLFWRAG